MHVYPTEMDGSGVGKEILGLGGTGTQLNLLIDEYLRCP
jgi:hypothetical protein